MKKAPIGVISRRTAGFTILELMITVAVLAIMLGIGIPSFQDMIRRNRLTTQTNAVLGALAIARSEAVKRGVRVTVCPENDREDPTGCSEDGNWAANGLIIFSDALGEVGTVNVDADNPQDDDVIIQRIPQAIQTINIGSDLGLISYAQDGALAEGTPDLDFLLTPDDCHGDDGGRLIEVITAGRASVRKVDCAGN